MQQTLKQNCGSTSNPSTNFDCDNPSLLPLVLLAFSNASPLLSSNSKNNDNNNASNHSSNTPSLQSIKLPQLISIISIRSSSNDTKLHDIELQP